MLILFATCITILLLLMGIYLQGLLLVPGFKRVQGKPFDGATSLHLTDKAEQLGFISGFRIMRFAGQLPSSRPRDPHVKPFEATEHDRRIAAFDAACFSSDRPGFAAAFVLYELALYAAAVSMLGGAEAFAPAIVGQVLFVNAVTLVGLVGLHQPAVADHVGREDCGKHCP